MKQVLSKVLCLKKTPQTHVPRSCRSVCGSCSCVSCSSCLCLLVSESQKHEMTGCCPFTFLLHLGNTSNKHKVSACYLYYQRNAVPIFRLHTVCGKGKIFFFSCSQELLTNVSIAFFFFFFPRMSVQAEHISRKLILYSK